MVSSRGNLRRAGAMDQSDCQGAQGNQDLWSVARCAGSLGRPFVKSIAFYERTSQGASTGEFSRTLMRWHKHLQDE